MTKKRDEYEVYYRPLLPSDKTGYVGNITSDEGIDGAFDEAVKFYNLDPDILETEGAIIKVHDLRDGNKKK